MTIFQDIHTVMNTALPIKLAAIATLAGGSLLPATINAPQAQAASIFGETTVNQSEYIAVAAPFGTNNYNLVIIRQIPGMDQCWSESGSNPVVVDPLLLTFNFTGHCSRSTDSNGYSIRIDNEDYGLEYLLNVVPKDNELLLVGRAPGKADIVVGRTYGLGSGYLKIHLDPGWEFTRRTYNGTTLGHVYLSGDSTLIGSVPTPTAPTPTPTPTPSGGFSDISGDIYRREIEESVAVGFISGFPDNTFRPSQNLTREQVVSMVLGALSKVPNANIQVPSATNTNPFRDVASNRWSAAKIAWAKDNNIVSGYSDGSFKPDQPVKRGELMAILRRATEFANERRGMARDIPATTGGFTFTDVDGHWAGDVVDTMASFCGVASPVNETGSRFQPESASQRNYAATATLRMLNCIQ